MSELYDKLQEIKYQKDTYILPENLKAGITCLGITGTLESGGSSDYNAKLVPTNGRIILYITEISENLDTSSVTNMSSMFDSCTNLTTVPQLNTSSVTSMNYMFNNCKNLTTIPLLDTSSVTDMNSMFNNCPNLTTIPLLNTSSVTSMNNMFRYCKNLSDNALNNILKMCINATKCTSTKTLKYIGLTSAQATKCTTLSNWSACQSAGWTTGY